MIIRHISKVKLFIISLSLFALFLFPKPSFAEPFDCPRSTDVNHDGVVNLEDSTEVSFRVGSSVGDTLYSRDSDINCDGIIDARDVGIVQNNFTPPDNNDSNQGESIPPPVLPESPIEGFSPDTFIADLISAILPIILGIAGFITVIFIIISGIQFMTSSGNPEAAGAARSRLTFAIIGFVIIVLAFAITQIVDRIFLGGTGVF